MVDPLLGPKPTDLRWERAQEEALRAFHGYDADGAVTNWRSGLAIAEAHFSPIDPRLATSLTNIGFARRRLGEESEGDHCLRQALEIWQHAQYWADLVSATYRTNGSSMCDRDWFDMLAQRGFTAAYEIWRHDRLPEHRRDLWSRYRPRRAFGVRTLIAAVLFVASDPPDPPQA